MNKYAANQILSFNHYIYLIASKTSEDCPFLYIYLHIF